MGLENEKSEAIAENVQYLLAQIAEKARQAGRKSSEVSLVAVTKTQDWSACSAAIRAGALIIGENRLQEAAAKFPADLGTQYPGLSLHFIGHLQKNKVRKAVSLFSCIQSIDNLETLRLVSQEAQSQGRMIDVFLEVNTSGEPSKNGCRNSDEVFHLLENSLGLPSIHIRGLMTIGPLGNDENRIRAAFAALRDLSEACREKFAPSAWGSLSMGMSGDYPLAIAEGATHVRIGTALFGPRLIDKPGAPQ